MCVHFSFEVSDNGHDQIRNLLNTATKGFVKLMFILSQTRSDVMTAYDLGKVLKTAT